MDKNWTTFEVLRQTRHDWLNKIQIIKGNLELNKIDRVKGYIEEIIIETPARCTAFQFEFAKV